MSSKIDVSLDELVKKNRSFRRGRGRRGGTRGFGGRGGGRGQGTGLSLSTRGNRGGRGNAGRGRGISISTRGGLKTAANVTLTPGTDLRDKLKKTMPDLRSAIKARSIRENKAQEGIKTGFRTSSSSVSSRETSSRTKTLSNQTSSSRSTKRSLPSSSRPTRSAGNTPDPKKIRITVPGLSHPRSETEPLSRREERLSQSIAHQREQRHAAHARMRDDYAARSFTSALKSSMYPGTMRGPSPPRDVYNSGREKGYGTVFSPETQGISTGTVLMISNLSGTVSRTDIIDLCEVCGPIESAQLLGRGVAEVVFLSKDDAQEAYRRYHKRNLDGMPMICKLVTDTRASGLAMADPILARYSDLHDYDHAQNWLY